MNRLARTTAFGIVALLVLVAGCGDDDTEAAAETDAVADTAGSAGADEPESGEHVTLRLGYFPNVTHATRARRRRRRNPRRRAR